MNKAMKQKPRPLIKDIRIGKRWTLFDKRDLSKEYWTISGSEYGDIIGTICNATRDAIKGNEYIIPIDWHQEDQPFNTWKFLKGQEVEE